MSNHKEREPFPNEEQQMLVPIGGEESPEVAQMKAVLETSNQSLEILRQERLKNRRAMIAAVNYLVGRARVKDMIGQATVYPTDIAGDIKARGQKILNESAAPSPEVQAGLEMILPPGWGRLPEAKEKPPVTTSGKVEEFPKNPLANKLWAEIQAIKQFPNEPSRKFTRALVSTIERKGLTREELLTKAYQPEIERGEVDPIKDAKKLFGPLMRGAKSTFPKVHHEIVPTEEQHKTEKDGEIETAIEKRYRVVPESQVALILVEPPKKSAKRESGEKRK